MGVAAAAQLVADARKGGAAVLEARQAALTWQPAKMRGPSGRAGLPARAALPIFRIGS